MAITFEQARNFLKDASAEDIKTVIAVIKRRQNSLNAFACVTFNVGDKVYFDSRRGYRVHGVVFKVNKKNIVVSANEGGRWNVSASLLHPADPAPKL